MKRNFKLLMLSLLGALSFVVAGCSNQKPTEQPGGNNTTQPDTQKPDTQKPDTQKPNVETVYKTVYEAAKAQGYAGTETEWNKEVEDIFANQDYSNVKYDAVGFATTGEGKPSEALDNNLNLYFNNNSKTVYTRAEGSTSWTEKTNDQAKTSAVTIANSEMSFVLFDDNYIRLSLLVELSNGHTLFINKEVLVLDVSLTTTELDIATTFDKDLNVVVTYEFNNKINKFIVPMTSSIVVKNEIKKEVGLYSVSVKLEGLNYPKTVEVINSKKTLFEAAQIVGFEGDETAWGELVTKMSKDVEVVFSEEELAAQGITKPSDDLDSKVKIYIDTFAHKYYTRNHETNKWEDKMVVPTEPTTEGEKPAITIDSVNKGLLLFDDNTYRMVTVYTMSNGYTLCDIEDINVTDIKLSNNELDIIDPEFDVKYKDIKVVISLSNNVKVMVDMNSKIVVKNEFKKEVGAHSLAVKFDGLTYPLTINVIDSTPKPEEKPKA